MGKLSKVSSTYAEMDSEEAKSLRRAIAKKIEYQKQFDPPEAPSRIYHGSQNKIDKFEARPHYLAEDEPVVFGTPSRAQAISFLAPWRDSDLEQYTINDDPTVHMREGYPGAFEKIYKGRKGHLYELDPSNFEWGPQLMRSEFISKEAPEVLNSEELDVYEAMLAEEAAGRLKIHRAKEKTASEQDLYVYHAVPRGNRDSVAQRGILSGAAILEDPEMLKDLAKKRNWTEEQTAAKIRKNLEDEYWHKKETSPSVFFSEPDWSQVPEWHTLRQDPYDLYKVNLSKYMQEVPGAKIHGVELKPWVEGTPYEEREITLEEAAELASRGPKGLWKDYSPVGGYYAVDVPHAFLGSDANKIPAEYVELMGELTPGPLPEKRVAAKTLKQAILKTASEQDTGYTSAQLALAAPAAVAAAVAAGYGGYKAHQAHQQTKEVDSRRDALETAGMIGAGGLAAAGVGVGVGKALKNIDTSKIEDAVIRGIWGDRAENEVKLREFLKDIGTEVDSENYSLTANDGRKIRVNLPADRDQAMRAAFTRYQQPGWTLPPYKGQSYRGGEITLGRKFQSPETFLHELGHATGKKIPEIDIERRLKITKGTRGAALLAALAGRTAATKEQAEVHNNIATAIVGAEALNQTPKLLEEARANIRAHILAKRLGYKHRLGVKPLLFGMGTYAVGAARNLALPVANKLLARHTLEQKTKTASEQDFAPDFTPDQLKELGVYDQVYGDAPSEASMKEWPEHWINKQDPLGWLQWYDRYSQGRRTDDDSRQIKRWKSFKARHLAQYLKNPTPRRAAALRNWGIDVSNQDKTASDLMFWHTLPVVTGIGGAMLGESVTDSDYGKYIGGGLGILGGNYLYHNYVNPEPYNKLKRLLKAEKEGPQELETTTKAIDAENDLRNAIKTAAKGTATKRDPKKWSAAKSRAKAKMGGKWSARAAQLAVKYYKGSGGRYSGKKPTKKNNKLKKWTKEEWGYRPGSKAEKDSKKSPSSGTKGRYLPKKKWQSLSKSEQKATDAKKKRGMKKGKGIVANTAKAKYDSKKDYTKSAQDSGYTPAQLALAASIAGAAGYGGYRGYQSLQNPEPQPLSTKEHLDRLGLGALASTAIYGGSRTLRQELKDSLVKNEIQPNLASNRNKLLDFLRTTGTQASPVSYELTANDGRRILVDLGVKNPSKASFRAPEYLTDAARQRYQGGAILLGNNMQSPEVFFHELGHATGKRRPLPYNKRTMGRITKGTSAAAALAALAGGTASTKEEAEAHNTLANVILGTSVANQAPLFVEEARANLRAPGLAKRLGYTGKLNNKMLLGSIGAYGLGALKSLALPAANKLLASRQVDRMTKESAQDINSLQYPSEVAPRFQGYVSQKRTKITVPIEDLPQPPPPDNDSETTFIELLAIKQHMEEGRLPEAMMIMADREPERIFHLTCVNLGLDPKIKEAEVIKEDFNKIAFDLKYKFMRPRPWSLSDYHGINLNVTVPESADTPSYPSGHAMMGYGLAEFYKQSYPEHSETWEKIADMIQHSRLQAGLHFPSDNNYARQVVESVSSSEKLAANHIESLKQTIMDKVDPVEQTEQIVNAGLMGIGSVGAIKGLDKLQDLRRDYSMRLDYNSPLTERGRVARQELLDVLRANATSERSAGLGGQYFTLRTTNPASSLGIRDIQAYLPFEDLGVEEVMVDPNDAFLASVRRNPRRGDPPAIIGLGRNIATPESFFHELGHATGRSIPRISRELQSAIAKKISQGAAIGALAGNMITTKDQAKYHDYAANAILGASALNQAPLLAEEARASIRALGLAKRFGLRRSLRKADLGRAFASYGINAASEMALPIVNKYIASRRRDRFEDGIRSWEIMQ